MLMQMDITLFNLINKACSNKMFDIIMPFLTRMGSGAFLCIVAFLIVLAAKDKKICGMLLLAGLSATYYVVSLLKDLVARPRPFNIVPYAHTLVSESGNSFPSAHAAMAFMAALILTKYFKNRWIFFALAALVGFSRVYIGVHFVSDVLAGAAIGILTGFLLVKTAEGFESPRGK